MSDIDADLCWRCGSKPSPETRSQERDDWCNVCWDRVQQPPTSVKQYVERLRERWQEAEGLYQATATHLRLAQGREARLRGGLRDIAKPRVEVVPDDLAAWADWAQEKARALLAEDES